MSGSEHSPSANGTGQLEADARETTVQLIPVMFPADAMSQIHHAEEHRTTMREAAKDLGLPSIAVLGHCSSLAITINGTQSDVQKLVHRFRGNFRETNRWQPASRNGTWFQNGQRVHHVDDEEALLRSVRSNGRKEKKEGS